MQVGLPCSELPIFRRRRRLAGKSPGPARRIVKGPVLYLPLAALHHHTANTVKDFTVGTNVAGGKVHVRVVHP